MFSAAELLRMDDREIATYASGSYGPEKRGDMMRSIRAVAEKAVAKGEIVDRLKSFVTSAP